MSDPQITASEEPGGPESPSPSSESALTASAPPEAPEAPAAAPVDEAGEPDEQDLREVPSEETVLPNTFTAPTHIALSRLENDETFLIRSAESLEDVSGLATDIARLGQLFPIEVRVVDAMGPDLVANSA